MAGTSAKIAWIWVMQMRKKDYELIARALRYGFTIPQDENCLHWTVEHVARMLESENPKFDRQKFLTACGIETKVLGINWADGTSTIHTDKGIKTVPTEQVQQ